MENFGGDADQFAALIVQRMRDLGAQATYDPDEFRILLPDGHIYLGNIFREIADLPGDEREERIARFLGAVQDMDEPDSWPQVRSALRPIMRPSTFGQHTPDENMQVIARPTLPFLHELVAVDLPNSRAIVSTATLDRWGVTADDVFAAAHENLTAMVGSRGIKQSGILRFADNGDGYCTSWPLIPGWLAGTGDGEHRPIAFLPDVDTLLITPDTGDLGPFFALVERQYRDAVRPISPQGYTIDDHGAVIPLDQSPHHRHLPFVQRARCGLAVTEYDAQSTALNDDLDDDLAFDHHDDLDPAFIGSVMFAQDDTGPFTLTIWGEGVEYLLPEADRILFCRTDENNEMETLFEAPFATVAEITGLTPIPGMTPRRYEVRHWPDPSTLTQLQSAAITR
ncbi:hypothetical protein [Nocardia altamirensis]|uniref:hypothetical protein n=1 Tax=Nocardia altamirensis TaxID=472158 RepID=UPI000840758A|nr:hypothetical protein [Nocardia altamirensis]